MAIFPRDGGADDPCRQGVDRPVAIFGQAAWQFVAVLGQERAVPVIQDWRCRRCLEMRPVHDDGQIGEYDRGEGQPSEPGKASPDVAVFHGPITSSDPALAPATPCRYIISAVPGGSVNLPAVPARARKWN